MAVFRLFPSQDTFITDLVPAFPVVPVTGSNFGRSEVLELFKKLGVSGALGWAGSSSLGHVLVQFDLSPYQSLSASLQAPMQPDWWLSLKDSRHPWTLPSSYDVEVMALSRSWDEGSGLDTLGYVDQGQANWVQAQSNIYWTSPGGDFLTGTIVPFHFDHGTEDLTLAVGSLVQHWLSGVIPNNGFAVRISSSQEADGLDYYV